MLTNDERLELKQQGSMLVQLVDNSAPDQAIRLSTARISQIISTERKRTRNNTNDRVAAFRASIVPEVIHGQ